MRNLIFITIGMLVMLSAFAQSPTPSPAQAFATDSLPNTVPLVSLNLGLTVAIDGEDFSLYNTSGRELTFYLNIWPVAQDRRSSTFFVNMSPGESRYYPGLRRIIIKALYGEEIYTVQSNQKE